MKKLLLLIALFTMQFAFAIENTLEKPNLNAEFTQLELVEAAAKKGNQDFETLASTSPEVLEGLNLNTTASVSAVRGGDLPAGIPAIVWGFCCCILGVALVYFQTDNDKEQVKKAAIGCVIGAVVGIGISFLTGGFGSGGYYY